MLLWLIAGTGAEVQSKMHFPGYYSIPNISSAVSHGSWSLLHDNRNLKNGQQYEVFLTRPVTDGFHGWHKEKLRQTILKHESIFKHQLNELHHLYERQEDLMNEMRSKELLKHKKATGVSQSTFSSSGFPTGGYTKSWHLSNLPLVDSIYGRQSTSSTCISKSPCDSIGKTLQNSGVPSQSRVGMKDDESSNSREKKPRRRLFNLELPADEYLSDEEEPEEGLGLGTDKSGCNNNVSSSGLHLVRSKALTNLNEPIQIDKVPASTSVVMSGSHPCSKEEKESQVLSANAYKGVGPFAKKFPENPQAGKDGQVHDLHLRNGIQKEWSTNALKAEQTRSSSGGSFGLQDFNKPCESSETEARIACEPAKLFTSDQNKAEKRIKRTLFGIEISESDISSSSMALQSDAAISQSCSNCTKPPSSLSQNLASIQVSTSANTSTQSNRASIVMPESREVIRDRLLLDCNSIPSTPSLKDEVSHQSGFSFRAKLEANELLACHPSMSLARQGNHSSLGHRVDVSAIDVNDVPPTKYLHGVTCEENIISLQGMRHQESGQGRLHWLEAVSLSNGVSSKESEGSHQLKIDSLQNLSKQFVNRADFRNGRSQGLIPDSSSLMHGHDAENGYSAKTAFDKSDMVQDPVSRTCREQLKADGLVLDKGFSNENSGSRQQIDINRCLTEEETETTAASPIMRTETVIDLEAPVVVETDIYGDDSIARRGKDSPHEGLIRVAAEALVAISSSQTPNMQDNATAHKMDSSQNNSLLWFAKTISSCDRNLDDGSAAEVKRTDIEESFPDVTDCFEHMTLNLVETKEEWPCNVPPNSDNLIEEVTLSKQPQRGQSRRGRQWKDFQRDVLPGLVSLSRNEVTDDLQIIEGLIMESGGSWLSSLSQRNSGKGGRGRGRKHMGTSAPSTTVAEVNQPQIKQPKCVELQGLEERNLTCWGKRTRRPPWQRYQIDNSPIPLY
ncbi:hypothetical protein ACFX10_045092 [Malus domestica]